ncbi:transmembrane 255A isoform X2 [Pelobates cultripes]|uniref:Transmembrane protein 255A n=1 Tax=Pelobates cultripes TaxID=61616 RepID=A0AAD1T295_PELCU|nr:transmembrane 255A isoform X2 [Pelobates cultripes]
MLTQQQSQRTEIQAADSTGSFNKRRRNSVLVTVTLLIVSILIFAVGLAATTRTENVTVGGYYPGVILGFGSILGIIGSNLIENKRQMDLRPLYAGKCSYFTTTQGDDTTQVRKRICYLIFAGGNYFVWLSIGVLVSGFWGPIFPLYLFFLPFFFRQVTCQQPVRGCFLKIKSNTCYCCDLYNCGRLGVSGLYYEYIDVRSCQDVVHLYHLLWSVTILNIVGLFLGIITAAVLGGFKDMNPTIPAITCILETPRPRVQYNTRPPVPSYNTYYHSTPHLPPYTAYDLQHSTVFPTSTPSGLSDDPNSTQSSSSLMWPSNAPPRYSPPYMPPDEKPPPYTP